MPSYHPKKSKPSWNEPWKRCRWHWEVRGDFRGMEVGKWVRTFWGTMSWLVAWVFFEGKLLFQESVSEVSESNAI